MARPHKNNAEYFSHDADMRNDKAIKAVRRRFKLDGYAVYNMILETLTDAQDFRIELTDNEKELLAGDFDVDINLLDNILKYLIILGKLQVDENNILRCDTLEGRFKALLARRSRERTEVLDGDIQKPVTGKPQITVDDSKGKTSNQQKHYLRVKEYLMELAEAQKLQMFMPFKDEFPRADLSFIDAILKLYLKVLISKDDVYRENKEYRSYFHNWFRAILRNPKDRSGIDILYRRLFPPSSHNEVNAPPYQEINVDEYIKKIKES